MDSQALVDRVIREARIPRGNSYREASVLLPIADDVVETELTPELIRVAGRYLSASVDVPLVAGRSRYRLPERAVRGEYVQRLDAERRPVPREDFTQAELPNVGHFEGVSGTPRHWYFEGDVLVVLPRPVESGGFLRLTFTRRVSRLALAAGQLRIASVASASFTVTGGAPAGGTSWDVVRNGASWSPLGDGVVVTGSGPYGFTAGIPEDMATGDYLMPVGMAPGPQLPQAYHVVLVQAVVLRVLQEMRQESARAVAEGKLATLMAQARDTVAPRTREPRVVVQKDW